MPFTNRGILQFSNRAQRGDHVLQCLLQLNVGIPGAHLFVEQFDIALELLDLAIHYETEGEAVSQ